jgi:hypothetical protein
MIDESLNQFFLGCESKHRQYVCNVAFLQCGPATQREQPVEWQSQNLPLGTGKNRQRDCGVEILPAYVEIYVARHFIE